jgi:hypothetical protein
MNEDSILLIEDEDIDRWKTVKNVATSLNLDYYPKTSNFLEALTSVDEWLHFILEKHPFVCIDLQIGCDGGFSQSILRRDVMEIVRKIQNHPKIQSLDCQDSFDLIQQHPRIPWIHKVSTITATIAQKLDLRCVTTTDGAYTQIEELLGIDPFPRLKPFTPETLRQSILSNPSTGYNLQDFWRNTQDLDVHQENDREEVFKSLRQLLGIDPKSHNWLANLSDYPIAECLKTFCGKTATIQGGEKSLSLLGAFHVLMAAISLKAKKTANSIPIEIVIEPDNGYFRHQVIPYQSMELARVTVRLLYKLFGQVAVYDEGSERAGEVMIQRIHLSADGLDITLNLHTRLQNWKAGKTLSLAETLNYAARNHLEFPTLAPVTTGEVSKLIIDFNQAANIKDQGGFSEGLIFPQGGGIEVHSIKDQTILRLKPCPIS